MPMFGPPRQQGFMGQMNANADARKAKDFKKEQTGQIDDITQEVLKFTQWLDTTGLLEYYDHLKDDYNANNDIEKRYADYIKGAGPASGIKVPAGYRLPKFRYNITPLSEVMHKYLKVMDILDDTKRPENIAARSIVDARRIVELTDWCRDYAKKYNDDTASFDVKIALDKALTDIKVIRDRVDNVRASLELYLDAMGISLDELRKNPNDLKDMASDVEGLIKDLMRDEEIKGIQSLVVQRYSNTYDTATNPFIFPLNDPTKTSYAGISLSDLIEKMPTIRERLFALDSNIRSQAMQSGNIGTDLTPLSPKHYFVEKFVPPSLNEMQASSLIHEYMYDGYLGYWLQNIVNILHEIKLAGLDIMETRLKLAAITTKLNNDYLGILTSVAPPEIQNMPIFTDLTADSLDLAALKETSFISVATFKQKFAADYAKDITEVKKQITLLQKATPLVFSLYQTDPPATILVPEVLALRRIMLLDSLAYALTNNQPFSPKSYREDVLGDLPACVWPALTSTAPEASTPPQVAVAA
jgi:hypothetical protein